MQQGPYDPAALSGLVGAGTLTRETLVWKDGMAGWLPAAQVPEVGGLFGAAPPPLPPGLRTTASVRGRDRTVRDAPDRAAAGVEPRPRPPHTEQT